MSFSTHTLTNVEINRFSRQLVLPGFGIAAQEHLKKSRVLIVGAGGLGCPVAIYLAAAGIGTIGIVDHDQVSLNNLHRQVMHDEDRIGVNKARSLKMSINRLNLNVEVVTYEVLITSKNAFDIVKDYNIIVDCTDNVPTRYLLNDTCVLTNKPLVSGSALGWEGQLTVYNNGPKCPCYRCIFPVPPIPSSVVNCSDGGVLGPIVGVIGSLQALEVLRIASNGDSPFSGYLWLFDGLDGRTKTICLREKMSTCAICSKNPTITELQDYVAFCGSAPNDQASTLSILPFQERITVQDYSVLRYKDHPLFLIDVRSTTEFQICHLPEAKNIPLEILKKMDIKKILKTTVDDLNYNPQIIYVVCHHGNDSQLAVNMLKEKSTELSHPIEFRDLIGGLESWSNEINALFPRY